MISERYSTFISITENNIKSDPKSFWKFVDKLKSDSLTPSKFFHQNTTSADHAGAVELFSDYFHSVFEPPSTIEYNYDTFIMSLPHLNTQLSAIYISLSDVFSALSKLNVDRAPGIDGFPNILLRKCRYALAIPLYILFNKSLSLGSFSSEWKISLVCAIHKKGDKQDITNYRPISIF